MVMPRRTRGPARPAWWTGIAALAALALYAGTWRMWALTVLVWCMYELCFCPTRCGVSAREDAPCRNPVRGRLFACGDVAGHQQLKTDALWLRNPLTRLRLTHGDGVAAAHRKTPLTPSPAEQGDVEPNQRIMAYVAVVGVLAVMVQAAVGLAAL
jgi:hypothetical protein